jgi:5-methylcytosine-specific restriction protein A
MIKRRAKGVCEAKVHVAECDGIGTQCDHVIAGDDHSLANLQWLSGPCHAAKTKLEALAGRAKQPRARRDAEQHPGLI